MLTGDCPPLSPEERENLRREALRTAGRACELWIAADGGADIWDDPWRVVAALREIYNEAAACKRDVVREARIVIERARTGSRV